MLKEERQQRIVEYLYKNGCAHVKELCDFFQVSHDTIRRDLMNLEELGEIKRIFGGALPYKRSMPDFQKRKYEDLDEKKQIAQKAISLLRNNQLIAIDGGTTNSIFASTIPHSLSLTIITNSFPIAVKLKNHKNIRTIILGGEFYDIPIVTGGSIACEQMESFHPDIFFLGSDSIHPKFGVSVPYQQEVSIKRTLCNQSDRTICLCIQKKLMIKSKYKICGLEEVDLIITDNQKNGTITQMYPSGKIL